MTYLSPSDSANSSEVFPRKTVIRLPKFPELKLCVIKFSQRLSNRESMDSCSSLQINS